MSYLEGRKRRLVLTLTGTLVTAVFVGILLGIGFWKEAQGD